MIYWVFCWNLQVVWAFMTQYDCFTRRRKKYFLMMRVLVYCRCCFFSCSCDQCHKRMIRVKNKKLFRTRKSTKSVLFKRSLRYKWPLLFSLATREERERPCEWPNEREEKTVNKLQKHFQFHQLYLDLTHISHW